MKKAIVTGASGFIGGWLIAELLRNDVQVIAIVRDGQSDVSRIPDQVRIVHCDLKNIKKLDSIVNDRDIDVFYHLAWSGTSGSDRANYEMQMMNVIYSCDAALVSKALGCEKFIALGTITENVAKGAIDHRLYSDNLIYGMAKHTTRSVLDIICHKNDISYVWAQLSNIYGDDNRTGNILSYTISELLKGNKPKFSKAEQPYDLMYVGDAARALFLLGNRAVNHSFYFIGTGTPKILKDYLNAVKAAFGPHAELGFGERPDDGATFEWEWFDTSALLHDTGFTVRHVFEVNIKEIIAKLLKDKL